MAGVDDIIARESAGDPNATNSRSSAGGLGQFIDSTWLDMLQRHRPDLLQGRSRADLLQLKFDPQLSKDMTAAYAADNNAVLSKAGIPITPGATYLAHFAGPQGAVNVMNADPATPVSAILDRSAITSNPFLRNMSAADLRAWADGKKSQKGTKPTQGPVPDTVPTPELGNIFAQLAPVSLPALTVPSAQPQLATPLVGSGPTFSYIPELLKRQKALS
ncbi:lytic transglycosylase domain-containing protein [Bradyrhizobium stylosanthis]|uniref:Transglycosylase-like protein with SLT domain n=1 Tax=Bradyrhizobium stylosanthis TaxID=1803665 RepID=A0A560CXM1_9BRAD|nr:lytic transglycosylase domain-containing protein [Bradyrhizobium stylosanthis]TWA89603.1 hypothetical protein FBZ96_11971 [Bradyrhizobium stylosanthis]